MEATGRPPEDDDAVPIFGTWRAIYAAVVACALAVTGRGNQRIDEFFLAGRRMRWWAVGLSVMATQISAITFVGTTGQAYADGMRFLVFYFGLPFAMVTLCLTVVPFFYRARVFTAYEYLEKRFDLRTRTLTSLLFLFGRGLSVGVTLYAPSLVLSVILGWGDEVEVEPVPPAGQIAALAGQGWYPAVQRDRLAIMDLAACPMVNIRRPRNLDVLPGVADALCQTFAVA